VRILHVTDCYLPRVGGIELHVRDLAERQRVAGHQVTVATRTPGGAADDDDVLRVLPGRRDWLTDDPPDVLHAHVSIVSPFALAAARGSARLGVPTVVTVHSLWTHVGPLPQLARDLWGMRAWDVTWTAVSDRAAQPVRNLLGVPVHVVPNAVDLDMWRPPECVPRTDPPSVLSVMRLTQVKRAIPLVRILGRVAEEVDFTATIVGDGPERDAVERVLRRHRLTDRVTLTGALDRPAIQRHLDHASIFLAPAHRESFGIAALEARATGVPVLASSRSGIASFIEPDRDGLLAHDDRGFADQLVTLLRDGVLRERLARHNRLVPPGFGWADALARNEDVYRDSMAHGGRPVAWSPAGPGVLVG
jgi:glycosyltransferase involved in cell wall biosynthesis